MVLGIPTVRREKETYLLPTLHNLVEAMNSEEAADSLIIVFIAETDMEYVLQTARLIENQYVSLVFICRYSFATDISPQSRLYVL